MSQATTVSRTRWQLRLKGVAAVVLAAALTVPATAAAGSSPSDDVVDVVALARGQVGDGYLWAGNGPDVFDCSGFTSFVWREAAGIVLPRVSRDQLRWAVPIPREQLLPGDLIFYNEPVDHVALFIGDGRVVDASSARKGVVERALWTAPITRYGRVPRPDMPPVLPWTPPPPPVPVTPAGATTVGPAAAGTAPTPGAAATGTTGATGGAVSSGPVSPPTPTQAPKAGPQPTVSPTVRPAATAAPAPTATAVASPSPPTPSSGAPTAAPVVRPLSGLPSVQRAASSPVALAAVTRLQEAVGTKGMTDVGVVRQAWLQAGGAWVPTDRARLVSRAIQIPRRSLRVGDLVTYGSPASQVYLYAGKGFMLGHSSTHGSVVVRRVHTGDVRFFRLPA